MAQYADGADFGNGSAVRFAHNQNVLHGIHPQGAGPAGSLLAFHLASPLVYAGNHPPLVPGAAAAAQQGAHLLPPAQQPHGVQPQTGFHPAPMAAPYGFNPQPLAAPVAAPYAPQSAPTPQPAPQGATTLPRHVSAAPGFGAVGPEGAQPNSPLAAVLAGIFRHAFSTQPVNHDTF